MTNVQLFIYDLSNGLAAQISLQLTGRLFKAIHHTSVVYSGREYFFGRFGVESSEPGQSPYGSPIERRQMGQTIVSPTEWQIFLKACEDDYGVGKYHLLEHNCNTFSDYALQYLVHKRLDAEILSLPREFLGTPLGLLLRPQIDAMYNVRAQPSAGHPADSNTDLPTMKDQFPPNQSHCRDRSDEAYSFISCPTLNKLFGELKHPAKALGHDAAERLEHQRLVEYILSKPMSGLEESRKLSTFLISYFKNASAAEIYPGVDIVRVLAKYESFAIHLQSQEGQQLLEVIFCLDYMNDETCGPSLSALLKLICNALTSATIRSHVMRILQDNGKLEIVASAALSEVITIVELGLKTIWNCLILTDEIDDDFAVSCLAAVAECDTRGHEELSSMRQKVLKELLRNNSQAIQEMIELLEIDTSAISGDA